MSDAEYKHRAFQLAREEIQWSGKVKQSRRLFDYFYSPPWGADLYRIDNKPIAYAIAYKCNSEGISQSMLVQDQDHLMHPEEPTGFLVRRSVTRHELLHAAKNKYRTTNVTTFTFLRDPLAHFISGLTESHFLRLDIGNHPSNVNSSEVQALFAHRAATVADAKAILDAIFAFDRDFVEKKLKYYSHYSIQIGIVKKWDVGFVGFVETMEEDWKRLNDYLRTNLTMLYSSKHITSKDPLQFRHALLTLFKSDVRYLRAVCRVILLDYICLSYAPPVECADMLYTTNYSTGSSPEKDRQENRS